MKFYLFKESSELVGHCMGNGVPTLNTLFIYFERKFRIGVVVFFR